MRRMIRFAQLTTMVAVVSVIGLPALSAQSQSEKRAMTIEDYARWRSIASVAMAPDGNWVTFGYRRHRSDDTLYIRNTATDQLFLVPRGVEPVFSDDSRWVAYFMNTPFDEGETLRKQNKPVPRKAGLTNLETGEQSTWDDAASVAFARGSGFLVVQRRPSDPDADHDGTDVILRHLIAGYEELVGSVGDFSFNDSGSLFAYTVDAADRVGNGLYLIDLESGARRPLDNDTLRYARMAWDEDGTALAVLKGLTPEEMTERSNVLLAFTEVDDRRPARFQLDPHTMAEFPPSMVISERGPLSWSADRSRVLFGIKAQEEELEEDEDNPIANVDIFHWNDERIQTVQEVRARADRNFTFRATFNLQEGAFVRLTDETMRYIDVTRDGAWGVGRDDREYISDWKESQADYYRVHTGTGERTLIVGGQKRTLGISPDSKYFAYWNDGHIWVYDFTRGERRNLTATAPVSFVNQEYDRPGTKPLYGIAGWTEDGNAMVLNHRYDLWLQPLNGSAARVLTEGVGEREETRFRYVRLDPEERFIDLSEPVFLSAYGQWTKQSGYYVLHDGRLEQRLFRDMRISGLIKATDADRVLLTMETFETFPDYQFGTTRMDDLRQITDANPWQSEYRWGSSVLFDYETKDGVRLQGTLAVPEGHQPGQRLPMLVDFYEKRSQDHHRYSRLVFRDTPMFAKYVSNGYLVMQPDVHFNTGTTHDDMLDAVEAATRKVIEMGYADPDRIGLHGHSYSGGGASYIATRSTMFAAIVAGAAPIDLAAEFNILFHGSGQNNHSYDIYGQGRYGTNPFDDFELYRAQSPITHVRTMDTPLLYLHGREDGSVEYLQGMEFYNALRFLGKPIIFTSYPGADHHLSKLENQKDFQTRMEQFYDHYLFGRPAPDWMVNGVPFLNKKRAARDLTARPPATSASTQASGARGR